MRVASYISPRFLYFVFYALAAFIGFTFHPTLAVADGINNGTDIVGLNLNMGVEQAKKYVSNLYPKVKLTKLTADINAEYYKQRYQVGYYMEIEPSVYDRNRRQNMNAEFDSSGEFIKVISGSKKDDLIGILRYKGYKRGSFPTKDTVTKSLIDKYGEPTSYGGPLKNTLTWYSSNAKIQYPELNQYQQGTCDTTLTSWISNLLFAGFSKQSFSTGKAVSDSTTSSLITFFNGIGNVRRENTQCGVVLKVHLNFADDWAYISSITESIIDYDRANTDLTESSEVFWNKADQAKNAKLKGDSSNKPDI
jgi:hypothetical protein